MVRVERLPSDEGAYNRVMQCVFREAAILDSPLLLTNLDALSGEAQRMSSLVDVAGQLSPRSLYATCAMDRPTIRGERTPVFIDLFPPSTSQRALLWHRSLGQGTSGDANVLADAYPLAAGLIVRAAESAKAHAGGGNSLRHEDVMAGIRSALDDRLSAYARRVVVRQSWNDLILTPDQLEVVVELMARVREKRRVYEDWGFADKVGKGLGVAALFSGPPGTGKTMVASLIAKELGLELYQVDLSRIMSKWIGETEKNLAGLFDAAEAGCAVLLFDEADALFGKRTDVKTSNDRHANLETNYLLQRLESFTGTCLLTTNHESNMDPAFQRRLSLHLRFSMPDAAERRKLWQSMLPTSAPRASDIDFDSLAARYVMSGGYIKNAVLRAAFLAANEDTAIAARHLEQAARVEYEGMGKVT